MAKRPPKKPPVQYFFPQQTTLDLDSGWIDFSLVENLTKAMMCVPSSDSRLIARMRCEEGKPAVMLPGVWGYCDGHGWQLDQAAIPDIYGRMDFPAHLFRPSVKLKRLI
jgi:hypothetical protein